MKQGRIVKWLGLLVLLLAIGAVVGGSILYATASASRAESSADQGEPQGGANELVTSVTTDDSEPGIVINEVAPDGPAAKAGLVRGDILLKIDDQPVNTSHQLRRQLAELEAGDEVKLTVLHGDEERTLTATLEERDGRPYLGLTPCCDLHMSVEVADFPVALGTVIVAVLPDSPAEQAGLREGDSVIAVDDREVGPDNDLEALITARQPGDTVTLEIERPGEDTLEITVELGEHPEAEGTAYLGVEYLPLPPLAGFRAEIEPFAQQPFDPLPPLDLEPFLDESFVMPPFGRSGMFVLHVAADSPAEEAGLRPGDFITTIDGQPIEGYEDLVNALAKHRPGETVTLGVERPGEEPFEVAVELGEHPEKEGLAYLGVEYLALPQLEGFEGNLLPLGHPLLPVPPYGDEPFVLQGEELE